MELLLKELKNTIDSLDDDQVPPWIRRYYHKLAYLCKKKSAAYNLVVNKYEDVNEDYIILEKQPAYTCVVAPYTCRTLKPFVVIDRETCHLGFSYYQRYVTSRTGCTRDVPLYTSTYRSDM
ncbi:uncharacterized protein LOC124371767 [Homalodisca vitripennis]|uniref:uncharacterized protein LOC124371767 n=1 Tax=Homalodisca vitripennis TaxID=197043 RepID=UPI001EEC897B|nr:uncharacterized protein LOC124371767 [Homalodisca vitripennis]XP_046686067.1 uncharacterized protein LOC124371767 [Homalodisca vitripennis]